MNRLLLTIAAMLTLAACSRGYSDDLRQADALMEAAPDSALTLLQAVDRAALSDRDLPYYALLYTQAQVKTNVVLTSDSLISIALEAFRNSPDPDLRKRAHFYAAQVAYYSGNMPDAMRGAIVAYEISKAQSDDYWHAKSAEMIGLIFADTYNDSQCRQFNQEAIDYYLRAGKILNHRFALCNMAIDYINQGQYNRAITILDSIRAVNTADPDFDTGLDDYASSALISALTNSDRFAEADTLIGSRAKQYSHEDSLSTNINQSYIATSEADANQLSAALMSAYGLADNDKDRLRVLHADYCNAMMWGNYPKAAFLADTLLWLQGKVAESLLNESVTSVQRDYYSNQAIFQEQKSRKLTYSLIAAIFIALIVITFIGISYYSKMKTKRIQLEANINAMLRLSEQSAKNKNLLESLFKDKWKKFNHYCVRYSELGDTDKYRLVLFKDIQQELNALQKPANLQDFIKTVDKYFDGIMTRLHLECTFLTNDELAFLSFIITGFSAKTISFLIGIKPDSVYQKKDRLIRRINQSSAPHKSEFIQRLTRQSSQNTDI